MIICAGEALVDLVPDPVPGGGPMNAAIAAARFGAEAAFLGRVSTDGYGQMIYEHLEKNGVDLRLVQRGDEPTARAIIEHTPQPSFRFEGTGTADTALGDASLDPVDPGPHIVHGGTLGMFRGATAEVLAELVEAHAGIVSLDANVRPEVIEDRESWDHYHQRWLDRADIVKLSDEDLSWIWPERSIDSVVSELLASDIAVVLVTKGPQGVMVATRTGRAEVPGRSVRVIDTVGAGDTFIGTVLSQLVDERGCQLTPEGLATLTVEEWGAITRRSVVASSLVCGRRGADPPTLAETAAADARPS